MKLILIILSFLVFWPSYAQELYIDKPQQDGSRLIRSKELFVRNGFTDRNPAYYSVSAIKTDSIIYYFFNIHINGSKYKSINTNGLILLKTADDSVIESSNILQEHETYDAIKKNIYGCYPVSVDDLYLIATGLKKVRIETPFGLLDIEYSTQKTEFISEGLTGIINDVMKSLSQTKNIRDGF